MLLEREMLNLFKTIEDLIFINKRLLQSSDKDPVTSQPTAGAPPGASSSAPSESSPLASSVDPPSYDSVVQVDKSQATTPPLFSSDE